MAQPAVSASPEQWKLLGSAVQERRTELRLSQEAAVARAEGMLTRSVWSLVERAAQPGGATAKATLRGICHALGWTPNSAEAILAGGEATLLPVERTETTEERLTRMEEELTNLAALVRQRMPDTSPDEPGPLR